MNARVRTLEDMHAFAYRQMNMQMGFLHLPSLQLAPLLVSFWHAGQERRHRVPHYAWRSEDLGTAVRVFTGSSDPGRLEQAVTDIEDLARAVAWVSRAPDPT